MSKGAQQVGTPGYPFETRRDYETAARELELLVEDDPDWLEPHVELATLYYRLHRAEDDAKGRQIMDTLTAKQQAEDPEN